MKHKRIWILTLSVMVLLLVGVGATLAFLLSSTDALTNRFLPSQAGCRVMEERFDGVSKQNVTVQNTGNVDAYMRVSVVCNFLDEDGNVVGVIPHLGLDYTLACNTADWFLCGGFYYCKRSVAPGENAPVLFTQCDVLETDAAKAYRLNMDFAAQCIQANPAKAVESAWKTVTVAADGTLTEVTE